MSEHLNSRPRDAEKPGNSNVESLASQVLSVLAARTSTSAFLSEEDGINRLVSAVRQTDESERDRVVASLLANGLTVDDLIDCHIPEAARRMGEAWCNDGMSFADVTIGTAKLQSLLRDLSRRASSHYPENTMAPQVLMVVREDDHHTLGAMVATQQLRRKGVGVHMSIARADQEVLALLASRDFDMVMISSSGSKSLETLPEFVENIRNRVDAVFPIVVGGTALCTNYDVKAVTGADFATADPEEALRRCGLKIPRQGADKRATLA